ncbi:hypothetical protein M8A51_10280 [Schlegelella sp. S2-27]|uniref:Uncharacterized protein n=1 Tax=Caldimonas mangrovi TaxID=2944811 RepID=A0ABT0YNC0_9BURK|nr:hypothetical protein [Caldimonas mangrovi]MCM5679919.1 hypothetical protein [Caldimonas mangrovi]
MPSRTTACTGCWATLRQGALRRASSGDRLSTRSPATAARGAPQYEVVDSGIAVTAAALPEDHEQALRSGFGGHWTQPISLPAFLAGIREHLGN